MNGNRPSRKGGAKRQFQPRKPLDAGALADLAMTYVARYATSSGKLDDYLRRKLRERGWSEEEENPPDPAALVAKHVAAGHVDDEAYARMRSGGLMRRGYGQRRVDQALYAAGIDEEVRKDVRAEEADQCRAALALGRKRRFGPFGAEEPGQAIDQRVRQKQIAAMLRAGHGFDAARAVVDAPSELAIEEWVAEAEDE